MTRANDCQPAATVLRVLGVRPLARALKLTPGAVSQWAKVGYGNGVVPPDHHAAVVELCARNGADYITKDYLMTNPSKTKGDRFEREIVGAMRAHGFDARRVPLSGAVDGFPGDVTFSYGGVALLGQCKISADGSGYGKLIKATEQGAINIVDDDGFHMVGMRFAYFIDFMRGGERAIKVENKKRPMKILVARKALTGHHVLFFRKDRGEAHALLTRLTYDFINR